MYNNNYGNGYNRYPQRSYGGYNRQNYGGGYAPQYRQQQPQFKKSGVKYTLIRKGKYEGCPYPMVNAWRVTRLGGLVTASGGPINGAVEHKAKTSGKHYVPYLITIVNRATGGMQKYPCLYCVETKKIVIKELGWVISPNGSGVTRSGKSVTGYFGRNTRR